MSRKGSKERDDDYIPPNPFEGLQQQAVIREAKCFSDLQVNATKCTAILTKILYLLNKGEKFTADEATDIFFGVTKLFQNQDIHLRRMVYLVIKDLSVESGNALMVINCLNKDMTSKTDMFRANSIRALAKIMEPGFVGQIERFLKQAVVDKNPFLVASTMVAGQHLFAKSSDVIKRWTGEVQEGMTSKNKMVQYHALSLMHLMKHTDKLAIAKMVQALVKNVPKGPLAQCLQIRVTTSVIRASSQPAAELVKFLLDTLHNKHAMVSVEAARALFTLDISPAQADTAIGAMNELLTGGSSASRFAAVRTLSQAVGKYPTSVSRCSAELEGLIGDANRSIATLAITTLLKTGSEGSIERLMKSITGFMSDISDEFKVVLVDAIRLLAVKFPHKYPALITFLATALRDEGGYKFKKSIVNTILGLIDSIPECKELALEQFCEFIEDCEFNDLSVKIINMIGEKGPECANPNKFIRFVFNRVVLEAPDVRCAAVDSLGRFGSAVPSLTDSVVVLLKRCLNDNDDEVRDRAVFNLAMLTKDTRIAHAMFFKPPPVPLKNLEVSLMAYLAGSSQAETFSLTKHILMVAADEPVKDESAAPANDGYYNEPEKAPAVPIVSSAYVNPHLQLLSSIPELKACGRLVCSSQAQALTEAEAEYVVTLIKHVYTRHVVLQFTVENNIDSQNLAQVQVDLQLPGDDAWPLDLLIPDPLVRFGKPGATFCVLDRTPDVYSSGPIAATLKFRTCDADDADDTGVDDEYQLEDVELRESDFMQPGEPIGNLEFRRVWEELGPKDEVIKQYALQLDSLQAGVTAVMALLGMQACESTATVPEGARSHAVNMTGLFDSELTVLSRTAFVVGPNNQGVKLKIAVRSTSAAVNSMLANAVR